MDTPTCPHYTFATLFGLSHVVTCDVSDGFAQCPSSAEWHASPSPVAVRHLPNAWMNPVHYLCQYHAMMLTMHCPDRIDAVVTKHPPQPDARPQEDIPMPMPTHHVYYLIVASVDQDDEPQTVLHDGLVIARSREAATIAWFQANPEASPDGVAVRVEQFPLERP